MVRTDISPPVRYAIWALVAALGVGLLWLGVMRYQEEQRALAVVPVRSDGQGAATAAQGATAAAQQEEPSASAAAGPTAAGPAPAPVPVLVVHVAGAVAQPGVYRLPEGARVEEALAAAGGARPDAAPDTLNLAARLSDGDKIYVPTLEEARAEAEPSPAARGATQGPGGASAPNGGTGSGRVNVNTAAAEELDQVNGIGPAIARAIVEYRTQHGPFRSLEELEAVPGIGPRTLEKLLPYLTL